MSEGAVAQRRLNNPLSPPLNAVEYSDQKTDLQAEFSNPEDYRWNGVSQEVPDICPASLFVLGGPQRSGRSPMFTVCRRMTGGPGRAEHLSFQCQAGAAHSAACLASVVETSPSHSCEFPLIISLQLSQRAIRQFRPKALGVK